MDPACLAAIAKMPPPLNVQCPNICSNTDFINGTHCSTLGVPTNTPIITKDPTFGPNGGYCYCCCSCFAMDTPIGVTMSEYVYIQDLNKGDSIMGTGSDLKWKETTVKYRSGGVTKKIIAGLYLVTYKLASESEYRQLLVSPDHLFLMFTQRKLKAVQHLIPGDNICGIDGKRAEVLFVAHGSHNTTIHTIELAGDFNGKDLDGHLLNSNGVVTADFAVQSHYEMTLLDDQHQYNFSGADVHEVGTKGYGEKFNSPALGAFLNDPKQWPKGFVPHRYKLINIPIHSARFLTDAQANDVYKNGVFSPKSITVQQTTVLQLIRAIRVYYPDTTFILDWENSIPNAYAWHGYGQFFVVVNGGLARLEGLYMDFISFLLVAMQSRLNEETQCVGEADYDATAYQMRKIWIDPLYATIMPKAIDQMDALFALISPEHAKGSKDSCIDPGIACRQSAVLSGLSFTGVPACAKPRSQSFELLSGQSDVAANTITIFFNDAVDKSSGESIGNYTLQPGLVLTAATMNSTDNKSVVLQCKGLKKLKYTLTVSGVLSEDGRLINPEMNTVIIGE